MRRMPRLLLPLHDCDWLLFKHLKLNEYLKAILPAYAQLQQPTDQIIRLYVDSTGGCHAQSIDCCATGRLLRDQPIDALSGDLSEVQHGRPIAQCD